MTTFNSFNDDKSSPPSLRLPHTFCPHLVLVDHLPAPRGRGVGGDALKDNVGGTVEEGAIRPVGVTRNPTAIGSTPARLRQCLSTGHLTLSVCDSTQARQHVRNPHPRSHLPVHVPPLEVEDMLRGGGRIDHEASRRMEDALGLAWGGCWPGHMRKAGCPHLESKHLHPSLMYHVCRPHFSRAVTPVDPEV